MSARRRPTRQGREFPRHGQSRRFRRRPEQARSSRFQDHLARDNVDFRENVRELSANHHLNQHGPIDLGHRSRADFHAIAEGRHAVGDPRQLLQAMRNIEDADALAPANSRTIRKRLSTSRSDSEAVGSSMMTMRACDPMALAISTSCCSGIDRCRASVSGSMPAPMRSKQFPGPPPPFAPADQSPKARGGSRAESDVFRDGQIGEKGRLLINRGDAEFGRLGRAVLVDALPRRC